METNKIADEAIDKIEVTPAMIEAGKKALAAYSPYYDLEEDGVRRIYLAMVSAKQKDR